MDIGTPDKPLRAVPLCPEMIPILQALANPMNQAQVAFDNAKSELDARRKVWADGLALCAFQLGLKPNQIEGFDANKAVFILRDLPDESSAPAAAIPSAPQNPEPSGHTASRLDLEGTPVPPAP